MTWVVLVTAPIENAGIITGAGVTRPPRPVATLPWQRAWTPGVLSEISRVAHQGNINNTGFGMCLLYIRLNIIVIGTDFVIQRLDLLIYGLVPV